MILFGRQLRDHLPAVLTRYQPRLEWRLEADLREQAFAKRHAKMEEKLLIGSKSLPPLSIGDTVTVQDQSNPLKPGKWTKTGKVVEILPHDSYMVIIHGSRAPTQRNRKFFRKISPFHPIVPVQAGEHLPVPLPVPSPAAADLPTTGQAVPGAGLTHDHQAPDPPVQQPVHLPLPLPVMADQHPAPPTPVMQPAQLPPPNPVMTPTALSHRLQPVAPPGQDIIEVILVDVSLLY